MSTVKSTKFKSQKVLVFVGSTNIMLKIVKIRLISDFEFYTVSV